MTKCIIKANSFYNLSFFNFFAFFRNGTLPAIQSSRSSLSEEPQTLKNTIIKMLHCFNLRFVPKR